VKGNLRGCSDGCCGREELGYSARCIHDLKLCARAVLKPLPSIDLDAWLFGKGGPCEIDLLLHKCIMDIVSVGKTGSCCRRRYNPAAS